MADRDRVKQLNGAAERAAGSGDFTRAAELLEQVVTLLENDAGASGDLANTLNNLGVACERLGRLDDAEKAYRRACDTAVAAYPADHPFVVRSTENLHDFLAARGVDPAAPSPSAPSPPPVPSATPVAATGPTPPPAGAPDGGPPAPIVAPSEPKATPEPPPLTPIGADAGKGAVVAPTPPVAADDAAKPLDLPLTPPGKGGTTPKPQNPPKSHTPPQSSRAKLPAEPVAPSPSLTVRDTSTSRVPLLVGIVLLVLVVASFLGARNCAGALGTGATSVTMQGGQIASAAPGIEADEDAADTAGADASSAVEEVPPPAEAAADSDVETTDEDAVVETLRDSTEGSSAEPVEPAAPTGSEASLALVEARVCRDFAARGAEWACTDVGAETSTGTIVYYTRLRTPAPASIDHHWYRGDALVQRVSLEIGANTGAGYRTYSRETITDDEAGTWRVQLRSAGGTVLHEASFQVR